MLKNGFRKKKKKTQNVVPLPCLRFINWITAVGNYIEIVL